MERWGIDDEVSEGDDVAEGVPGGEGREEEAVKDGVEIGDGWSSSDGGSELEVGSDIRGTMWNFFCKRFGTVAGDCGLIGDWVIPLARPPVGSSVTGRRGRKANLEAKFELGFEGAGECGFRKKGGCLGANVPPLDEVFFDPSLRRGVDGGVDGDDDNKGSNPTGTRFKS